MAQTIKLYGLTREPLKLRTATRFRFVVLLAHPSSTKLVKYASSDSLATASSKLARAQRTQWRSSTGVVVDLATGETVAKSTGPTGVYHPVSLRVTGDRGR